MRDRVGPHDEARALGQWRKRDTVRAHVADVGRAHGEQAAVAGQRQFDLGNEITSLIVAQERLGSRRGELDRTAELARGPQHEGELDEHSVAGAEIAADVVGQDPHAVERDAEDGRQLAFLPHRTAAAGMQGIASARGVVLAQRRARFEREPGHSVDMKVEGDNVVGTRERLLRRLAIAEKRIDRSVVGHLAPNHRGARPHRVFGMIDPGQDLVVDANGFRRIERLRHALGHDHNHGLADVARLVARQQRVRAEECRTAVRRVQFHVVFGLG